MRASLHLGKPPVLPRRVSGNMGWREQRGLPTCSDAPCGRQGVVWGLGLWASGEFNTGVISNRRGGQLFVAHDAAIAHTNDAVGALSNFQGVSHDDQRLSELAIKAA